MGRVCSVPRQRARVVASSTSRWTRSVPNVVSSSERVAGCSMAPPPKARTSASPAARRAMVACSRSRNGASPWRAKSSAMVAPASASITSSTSRKVQPRRPATSGPTVLLPEPMKPVRTMRRGGAGRASDWVDGSTGTLLRRQKPHSHSSQYKEAAFRCRSAHRDHHGSGGDEQAADEDRSGELFAQQQPGEEDDQGYAELIQRSHARGWAQLQGAEVAEPGQAGGQATECKKEHGAAVERAQFAVLAQRQ